VVAAGREDWAESRRRSGDGVARSMADRDHDNLSVGVVQLWDYFTNAFTGEAERGLGIPPAVTGYSLRQALALDGKLPGENAYEEFLDLALPPDVGLPPGDPSLNPDDLDLDLPPED
jgi:hypothetical protein